MKKIRLLWVALLVVGCTKSIDPGPQIGDLTEEKDRPEADRLPLVETERVATDAERAAENYEKLLDLPQDPATRAETLRRLADLQLEMDEAGGEDYAASEQRLRRSVALYETLLKEYPADPRNDRVLYQLSRAHQNLGELDKAESVLFRLTKEYPQSAYADEAHFRHAELLFRLGQYDEAEREYRYVLDRREATPFYEPAQYKYGWSLYKQSKFEQAVDTFMAVLHRELPAGELSDPEAAIEQVAIAKRDLAKDALRVVSLSLAALGGGEAIDRYFRGRTVPAYAPMIYASLGDTLLEKQRYTDAANAFGAFAESHPRHVLAPAFRNRAIEAQGAGGFAELVAAEKEAYVRDYDPKAPYWTGRSPTPEVLDDLRSHLEDLARHYQASAQDGRDAGDPAAAAGFQAAARTYRRLLELYPSDPEAPEMRFLLGESLFEAGDTLAAADEYNRVVADYPGYDKAPEAAYAAVLAYQRHAREVPEAQKQAALQRSVQAGLQLAERYPDHPQALAALTRAAEDLYQMQSWDQAISTAGKVLRTTPPAPEDLRRTAWSVTADAQFGQKHFPEAETAYAELLRLTPADSTERGTLEERLAASIYKQGEAARDAGNLRAAAEAFLRVGQRVPAASIRAAAEYDAAAALIELKDWPQAARVLENFRTTHAASPLLADVDKKLASVYESSGQTAAAAAVLRRIAGRSAETPDTRRDAAWMSASLLDQAQDPRAVAEYESYIREFPRPLDRAMDARQRLGQLARASGDQAKYRMRLQEIIEANIAAGTDQTPHSRTLAAEASLEIGRMEAQAASRITLRLPLQNSLPARKKAMESAIATLTKASDYGIAEVSTAAAFELGNLYQGFSRSLLDSDRPALSELELEQYNLLLEEQAFPFEERAIQWHEANLQHATQGIYNEWIGRSMDALETMVPARYTKRERTAEVYDELR